MGNTYLIIPRSANPQGKLSEKPRPVGNYRSHRQLGGGNMHWPYLADRTAGAAAVRRAGAPRFSVTRLLPLTTPPLSLTCRGREVFRAHRAPSGPACARGLLL